MAKTVPGADGSRPSRASYLSLGVAATLLGAATAVGVWLFTKAFGLVHQVVFEGVAVALAPLGAWTLVPVVASGGIVVALVVRSLRPEPLAAVPHIIDSVFEHDGRLNDRNAAVTIFGSAVGIGFGMPLGADTPSAMIGGHLGFDPPRSDLAGPTRSSDRSSSRVSRPVSRRRS